ncbi:ArsR family transcriptional regulator [Pseudomonas sp.]|uniref:ArsR family transcriptional regulator n=1 Tax=Pseudomonas sp. TaxID=306 RepID=UPI00258BB5FA|nr:ArsR family transcriptional regulator [Pseudomonas sp.]
MTTTDTSARRKFSTRRNQKVNAMTYAILIKLLSEGTRTCRELAEETGLHVSTVYDHTYHLHKQGVIHICMWEGTGRRQMRVFMLGPGRDAKRETKSREKIHADYRARRASKAMVQRFAMVAS